MTIREMLYGKRPGVYPLDRSFASPRARSEVHRPMTRVSLFDFERAEPALWTVSELTARIKATLEGEFPEVALRAEVSNVATPRSGHVYLVLKDDTAQIRAVLWKSDAQRLVFDLTDGLAVKVWGKLTVYAPRGEYQLTIHRIEPQGIGALELAFRQTVARLQAEGLFDPARKRPLPRFPRRIVVVTSPTGAAVRDFLQVTGRRWPLTDLLIAATKVQGAGAVDEIIAALALANRVAGADLIVVARGGGSLEDLWAFNDEQVARAIAASRLPVISAVGHEIDVTVADLVADRRALTPSEAGEIGVPDLREVAQLLDRLGERIARAGRDRIDQTRLRLDSLSDRALRALRRTVDDRRNHLARLAAGLEALSPLAVLSRGYSLTFQDDNSLVHRADDVRQGDRIRTRLAAGEIHSQVL
jgi:exodeoxyribonuclease VII large subunit